MAKLQSRLNAKPRIAPWKQLHHWQGLGLVLLMLPLGSSFLMGTALLEQANRQGLPKEGWAEDWAHEVAQSLGSELSGTRIAKAIQGTGQGKQIQGIARFLPLGSLLADRLDPSEKSRPISLRRRQGRVIKNEIDNLSGQAHQRLDDAIAPASPQVRISPAPSQAERLTPLAPDLRHSANKSPAKAHSAQSPYSPAAVENFLAIALGTEFIPGRQAMGIPHIRKWVQDLRIQVQGNPTPADIATLEQVVADINAILGTIELGFVESEPNLDIFFVAEQDFRRYEASYRPVNHGFFWSEADQGAIQRGRILISTTDINQTERSHLIREELTQSMGLMQDSPTDANSIFYQGWSQTQAYSHQDRQLLRMLYRPDIHPGMDAVAVERVLLGS